MEFWCAKCWKTSITVGLLKAENLFIALLENIALACSYNHFSLLWSHEGQFFSTSCTCSTLKQHKTFNALCLICRTWSLQLQAWTWPQWMTPSRGSSCPAFCVVWLRKTSSSPRPTLWWRRLWWPCWQIKGPDSGLLMTRPTWRKEVCRIRGPQDSDSFYFFISFTIIKSHYCSFLDSVTIVCYKSVMLDYSSTLCYKWEYYKTFLNTYIAVLIMQLYIQYTSLK